MPGNTTEDERMMTLGRCLSAVTTILAGIGISTAQTPSREPGNLTFNICQFCFVLDDLTVSRSHAGGSESLWLESHRKAAVTDFSQAVAGGPSVFHAKGVPTSPADPWYLTAKDRQGLPHYLRLSSVCLGSTIRVPANHFGVRATRPSDGYATILSLTEAAAGGYPLMEVKHTTDLPIRPEYSVCTGELVEEKTYRTQYVQQAIAAELKRLHTLVNKDALRTLIADELRNNPDVVKAVAAAVRTEIDLSDKDKPKTKPPSKPSAKK